MDIDKIAVGPNPPHEINVIVEVPLRSDPVKYEFDKARARWWSTASCTR